MPAIFPLLAKYAWPWGCLALLLAAIGVQQFRIRGTQLEVAKQKLLTADCVAANERFVLSAQEQNRAIEALRAAGEAKDRALAERLVEVRMVVEKPRAALRRHGGAKTAEELNRWMEQLFVGAL